MSNEPDWDRLGRETPWSRDTWLEAARYLGDLPNWLDLWPTVETAVASMGATPIRAAIFVRQSMKTLS